MADLLQWLSNAWAATSIWELIAVVLAIAYLLFAMKENILCWPAALISTAIYTWLFFSVTLMMESLLQLYYMAMAIYGWYAWSNKSDDGETLTITTWSLKQHSLAIALILVLTATSATLLENTSASYPWLDSFTTWSAVLTTWMVARKVLENWLYWIVINSISIYLYLSKDLYATSLLFGLYIILSISGYMMWKKHYNDALNIQS